MLKENYVTGKRRYTLGLEVGEVERLDARPTLRRNIHGTYIRLNASNYKILYICQGLRRV